MILSQRAFATPEEAQAHLHNFTLIRSKEDHLNLDNLEALKSLSKNLINIELNPSVIQLEQV